jgi:hypothetical protein
MAGRGDAHALLLQISADNSKALKKLEELQKKINGTAASSEKAFKGANDNINRSWTKTGGVVRGALEGIASFAPSAAGSLTSFGKAGLVAGAAIGALAVAIQGARAALKFGDEIGDAAQKIGVTTDTLQEFRYAISQVGGETKDADVALAAFTQTLGKAVALPTAKTLKPFKALGLDPKELGDVDTALKTVLDRLSRVQDEAQRQALAKALGLEQFIPLAREGAARINELREAAHKLGYVMDASLIAKAGEAQDKLDALEQVIRVQLASTLVELAPVILSIAQAFADVAKEIRAAINWINKFDEATGHLDPIKAASDAGFAVRRFFGIRDNRPGASTPAGDTSGLSVASIQSALAKRPPPIDLVDVSGGGGRSRTARATRDNTASATAEVNAALLSASRDALEAMAGLTENTEARARIAADILKLETTGKIAQIERQRADTKADEGLSEATKQSLLKKLDQVAVQTEINALLEQTAADQETANKLQDDMLASQREIAAYYDEIASIEAANARTAKQRRAAELKGLAARQRNERTQLEADLGRRVGSGEITQSRADAELAAQGDLFNAQQGQTVNGTMGPMESYFDSLPHTVDEVNERMEQLAANGIADVVDGLAGVAAGFESLGDLGKRLLKQLTYDFTKLNLEIALGMNTQGGQGGSGGFLKSLFKLGAGSISSGFGSNGPLPADLEGLLASGTDSAPTSGKYLVGEEGPEIVNLKRGSQVIPNDILRGLSKRGGGNTYGGNTYHLSVNAAPGMTVADARRTASQIHAELRRKNGSNGRKGF